MIRTTMMAARGGGRGLSALNNKCRAPLSHLCRRRRRPIASQEGGGWDGSSSNEKVKRREAVLIGLTSATAIAQAYNVAVKVIADTAKRNEECRNPQEEFLRALLPGPYFYNKVKMDYNYKQCNPRKTRYDCLVPMDVYIPIDARNKNSYYSENRFPLAVVSPGTEIPGSQYTSYSERLASHGFVTVQYTVSDPIFKTDSDEVAMLRSLIDYAQTSVPLFHIADTSKVFVMGHSRGAKVSILTAAEDPRIAAVGLLDPVDRNPLGPSGDEFPKATDVIIHAKRGLLPPLCVVAANISSNCNLSGYTYKEFTRAAQSLATPPPYWEIVVNDTGHMQFVDDRNTIPVVASLCKAGVTPDSLVRQVATTAMIAWGRAFVLSEGSRGNRKVRLPKRDCDSKRCLSDISEHLSKKYPVTSSLYIGGEKSTLSLSKIAV